MALLPRAQLVWYLQKKRKQRQHEQEIPSGITFKPRNQETGGS